MSGSTASTTGGSANGGDGATADTTRDDAGLVGAPTSHDGAPVAPTSYPLLDGATIGEPVMITTGFTLAESPLWDPCGHRLLFPDVQGGFGGGGVILALDAAETLTIFASNTSNTNGIAYDVDGTLILAQMGAGGHLGRRDASGMISAIEPAGSPALHTPDDVTVRSDGTIFFSDGDFYPIGSLLGAASQLPVYMLAPGANELVRAAVVSGPNGIELSPDEKTLYVSAYGAGSIIPFAVADDGTLTKGTAITGLDGGDSLCLDAAGNLYVGTRSGLLIMRPDGEMVKLLAITSSATTSCNFGGDDGKTLYITSWTTLYKVENMPIPGQDWGVNQERVSCP